MLRRTFLKTGWNKRKKSFFFFGMVQHCIAETAEIVTITLNVNILPRSKSMLIL